MVSGVYPGSFDPVHNGHVDVASRAAKLFSTGERSDLCREAMKHLPNVEVKSFKGLAIDFARDSGAQFIVRGLRAGFDFETEFEMALMWRNLAPDIDVVCMMSSLEYQFLYSSRIKEVAQLGGDVANLVPPKVAAELGVRFSPAS